MTKMAAVPIYGKNLNKIFSGTKTPMTLKLGMQHVVKCCQYMKFHEDIMNWLFYEVWNIIWPQAHDQNKLRNVKIPTDFNAFWRYFENRKLLLNLFRQSNKKL